jgi:hypothetical protein
LARGDDVLQAIGKLHRLHLPGGEGKEGGERSH